MNQRSIGIDLDNLQPDLVRQPHALAYPKKHPRLAELQALPRPRSEVMTINGAPTQSYGLTEPQYRSLQSLLRLLASVFPAIGDGAPQVDGKVVSHVLYDTSERHGVLAHWHTEYQRWDPGPGFDWQRLGLDDVPTP